MGAATFTKTGPYVLFNNKRAVPGTLTFAASYATGGDSFAMATQGAGLTKLDEIHQLASTANNGGISVTLAGTPTVPLMKAWETANTEVASTTNLSARTVPVWLIGS